MFSDVSEKLYFIYYTFVGDLWGLLHYVMETEIPF